MCDGNGDDGSVGNEEDGFFGRGKTEGKDTERVVVTDGSITKEEKREFELGRVEKNECFGVVITETPLTEQLIPLPLSLLFKEKNRKCKKNCSKINRK